MSLVADIRPMTTHMYARLTGEFDFEEFKKIYERVADAAHQHKLLKILLDGREVTGDLSVTERLHLGKFFATHRSQALFEGKTSGYRLAIVALPPLIHPQKIGMYEVRNRDLPTDIFERIEDAMTWLELEANSN
jgi:hypothetical protein